MTFSICMQDFTFLGQLNMLSELICFQNLDKKSITFLLHDIVYVNLSFLCCCLFFFWHWLSKYEKKEAASKMHLTVSLYLNFYTFCFAYFNSFYYIFIVSNNLTFNVVIICQISLCSFFHFL